MNEKPPVKSYCGDKPNYCTPEETFTLDRGCWERGCVAYDERDGDGVTIKPDRVDETAKQVLTPEVTPQVTPQVTGEVTTEVLCKTHPDAPHGFDRNASHSANRYVCECEGWEPDVDAVNISEKRVHKSDKPIHEPVAWADKVGAVIPHSHKLFQPALLKDYTRPLYTAPYTKNDIKAGVLHKEWVGLTNEEIADVWKTEYFNISYELPRAVEAKLKEKNSTDWDAIEKELPAEAFGEQSPVWKKRF